MLVQGEKLFARHGVPHLARAIVRSCDELVSGLVECTVGQGQQMGLQHFEQVELLRLILLLLLDQF